MRKRLRGLAPADTEELRAAWQVAAEGVLKEDKERKSFTGFPEQFLLLVTCRDEKQQVELLQRFHDGWRSWRPGVRQAECRGEVVPMIGAEIAAADVHEEKEGVELIFRHRPAADHRSGFAARGPDE